MFCYELKYGNEFRSNQKFCRRRRTLKIGSYLFSSADERSAIDHYFKLVKRVFRQNATKFLQSVNVRRLRHYELPRRNQTRYRQSNSIRGLSSIEFCNRTKSDPIEHQCHQVSPRQQARKADKHQYNTLLNSQPWIMQVQLSDWFTESRLPAYKEINEANVKCVLPTKMDEK